MKNAKKQESRQSKQGRVNTPRPDIRDNMDSRQNKEERYKDNNNKQGRKPNTKDKNEAGN